MDRLALAGGSLGAHYPGGHASSPDGHIHGTGFALAAVEEDRCQPESLFVAPIGLLDLCQ